LVVLVTLALATVWTGTAEADTQFPPPTGAFTVQVTTGGTTYSYPNGGPGPTIPDVTDGQEVSVTINDAPGGATVTFSRLRIRQCALDRVVNNNTEFNPQIFNRCSAAQLGAGSPQAYVDSGPVPPGTTTITTGFRIGEGTAPDVISAFDGELYEGFDCGPGNPCKLVVNAEVTTTPGSSNYVSFPISFFEEPPPPGETVLIDCDNLAGLTSVKAPLTNAYQDNVAMALKTNRLGDFPGQFPRTCEGTSAASAGPLTKVAAKFVGAMSCSSAASPTPVVLPSGKMTFTWTELDPVKLKPFQSSTFLRLDQSKDMIDEVGIANGIVTKGVGVGADVQGAFLHQPTLKNGPADQSTLAADGELIPGPGSLALASGCASGANTIAAGLWSTDGTTLTGAPFDSSIKFTLPA
jgi:hypothetical protein